MRGMIALTVSTTERLDECPCTLRNQTIEYWLTSSEVYRARDATITLERFASTGDNWYQAAGSFSGTLLPAEESDTPEGSEPIRIEGTFDIDRIRGLEL